MLNQACFDTLASYLKARSGLVIGPDKLYLLESRLEPVMKRHGVANLPALAERLRGMPSEPLGQAVVEAMTTNESFFFRDDKPFAHLSTAALPKLLASRSAGARLRIWSAACSTGQEAYSVAMLLHEQRAQLAGRPVEIIGTDIARAALTRAQEGVYSQFEVQRGLPMRRLVAHFKQDGAQWRIAEALRAMVSFREWNLLGDLRPLGVFDVIFCRNVLIYFDQDTKARVLDAMAQVLAPDGVLYLGGAETVLGLTTRLIAVPGASGVYQRPTG
jgi:chemotaxis protein methyltransferase CheR